MKLEEELRDTPFWTTELDGDVTDSDEEADRDIPLDNNFELQVEDIMNKDEHHYTAFFYEKAKIGFADMWSEMGFVFGGGRKMLNPHSDKYGRLVAY